VTPAAEVDDTVGRRVGGDGIGRRRAVRGAGGTRPYNGGGQEEGGGQRKAAKIEDSKNPLPPPAGGGGQR